MFYGLRSNHSVIFPCFIKIYISKYLGKNGCISYDIAHTGDFPLFLQGHIGCTNLGLSFCGLIDAEMQEGWETWEAREPALLGCQEAGVLGYWETALLGGC